MVAKSHAQSPADVQSERSEYAESLRNIGVALEQARNGQVRDIDAVSADIRKKLAELRDVTAKSA